MQIPWDSDINFASALLLHSCLTILTKESLNIFEITRRLILRTILKLTAHPHKRKQQAKTNRPSHSAPTSIVLDVYTSIFSIDAEGEQAELYYTNTGMILLASSLAASVAMNLLLEDLILNTIVASTYGLCFVSSMLVGKKRLTLPIMALRRAGRFIWSDTPLVNFFTLIYIATVLKGNSVLRLRDYVTFRCVAVLELLFMKAKLAASTPAKQERLMRRLIASEISLLETFSTSTTTTNTSNTQILATLPSLHRHDIVAFQTTQRMSVMLLKTSIGHVQGSLRGALGPCRIPLPRVGHSIEDDGHCGLRYCRPSANTILVVDNFAAHNHAKSNMWQRFIAHAHGVLLRRLGKVRVVYLIAKPRIGGNSGHISSKGASPSETLSFHSNVNLVTGVNKTWLQSFPAAEAEGECIVS